MKSIAEVYDHVSALDANLEKQAAELVKKAEEEDAAGRIMARGFADELNKLAEPYSGGANAFNTMSKSSPKPQGGTMASGGYSTGGGKTGQGYDPMGGGRKGGGGAMAAGMAGGGSKNPVGTGAKPTPPAMKPPGQQLAAAGGAPKPPKM